MKKTLCSLLFLTLLTATLTACRPETAPAAITLPESLCDSVFEALLSARPAEERDALRASYRENGPCNFFNITVYGVFGDACVFSFDPSARNGVQEGADVIAGKTFRYAFFCRPWYVKGETLLPLAEAYRQGLISKRAIRSAYSVYTSLHSVLYRPEEPLPELPTLTGEQKNEIVRIITAADPDLPQTDDCYYYLGTVGSCPVVSNEFGLRLPAVTETVIGPYIFWSETVSTGPDVFRDGAFVTLKSVYEDGGVTDAELTVIFRRWCALKEAVGLGEDVLPLYSHTFLAEGDSPSNSD